jgi:hypothetical protein
MTQATFPAGELPRVGSVTRCPNCGAPAAQFNRWPQDSTVWRVGCTACDFTWQEASARSSVDELRDTSGRVIASLLVALAVIGALFFIYVVFLLLRDAIGVGEPSAWLLGIVLLLCFGAIMLISMWRFESPDDGV